MQPLEGLFEIASGAWMYLVHPPGKRRLLILISLNNFLTGLII